MGLYATVTGASMISRLAAGGNRGKVLPLPRGTPATAAGHTLSFSGLLFSLPGTHNSTNTF